MDVLDDVSFSWFWFLQGGTGSFLSELRITEDSDIRITEEDDQRVTEGK